VAIEGPPRSGRAACDGTGPCQGACDGSSRTLCSLPGAGTSCEPPACIDGKAVGGSSCDGSGTCRAPVAVSCGDYLCAGNACPTSCTRDTDCAEGRLCSGGACTLPPPAPTGCGCTSAGDAGALALLGAVALLRRRQGRQPGGAPPPLG
jgi:MYXO-CTERM domain-containing protein